MSLEKARRQHRVEITQRHALVIEGVRQVISFSDEAIILSTEMGGMAIRGKSLRIQQVSLESGHLEADGDINGVQYTTRHDPRGGGGWLEKLWR